LKNSLSQARLLHQKPPLVQRRASYVVEEEAGTTVIKRSSVTPRTGHFFYVLIQLH